MTNVKDAGSTELARQAERQRQRDLIRQTYSASRMNNTKWQEAISAVEELGKAYRIQIVDYDTPSGWSGLINWHPVHRNYVEVTDIGPVETVFIEWLEIDPLQPEEIERRLTSLQVPYEWHDSFIRIVGYIR